MSAINIFLAVLLLLLSLMQKGPGVHGLPDYFCFVIFIVIAMLAALSAINENLVISLLGATIAILVLLFIALIYHLCYCYKNQVDIFEVAGSALIYSTVIIVSGFCTFIAIRWRTFVNLRKKVKKQRMNISKGSKVSLKQGE